MMKIERVDSRDAIYPFLVSFVELIGEPTLPSPSSPAPTRAPAPRSGSFVFSFRADMVLNRPASSLDGFDNEFIA